MKQNKPWLFLCAVILLLGVIGCLWVLQPSNINTVEIVQNGEILFTFDLSSTEDQTFIIHCGDSSNTIQIQDGQIRVLEAECPDQTCVHMGFLSDSGLPIVCLPNRLVIQFSDTAVDGATW